jgi:hypothetical protein
MISGYTIHIQRDAPGYKQLIYAGARFSSDLADAMSKTVRAIMPSISILYVTASMFRGVNDWLSDLHGAPRIGQIRRPALNAPPPVRKDTRLNVMMKSALSGHFVSC